MDIILKRLGPGVARCYLNNARVTVIRARPQLNVCSKSVSTTAALLSKSDSKVGEEDTQVVMTNDGRVIVCWHPEIPFPYEATKPLPLEVTRTHSLLKVQALEPVREVFRRKHKRSVVNELMSLTHTPKYAWQPKERRQQYKDMNPLNEKRDREGL